ncbi:MAG TPA: right-handed parallel beta-helix repeat-containing protein [Solirubrobacteraceae bacterium]|nr:right-handed parallel beta-helix repeat-containing protein [Solirubrobacteraceae bacterium]
MEGPDDPSTSRSATFRFRASDNTTPGPDLRFECRLDGGGFTACTSPVTYDGLALGDHTFAVRARDYQDNRDATPASHAWTVEEPPADTNPPETEIGSGPDPRTVQTGATLTFSSDEAGATFACSLDGGTFTACESPREYAGLAVGDHTVRVRAVDAAGNVDATPASRAWTIGPPPVARSVSCGTQLTVSTRITNDLADCGGDGLVVGAPGITIDLDGRTIDGKGVGAGVRNDGFDHVTITGGGKLQEFEDGVRLGSGTAHGIVADTSVQMNKDAGIQLDNADEGEAGNLLRSNTVTNNELAGIDVANGTQHARLLDNTVGANAKVGVRIAGSRSARVEGNRITASSEAGVLLEGASDNTLADNVLTGNGGEPVAITLASNGNRLEGNQVTANSKGVVIEQSNGNELVDNVFNELSDTAISLMASSETLIRGNDIRFNSGGVDVYQSSRNRLEENDVSENSSSGIWIGDLSYDNVVARNDASSNSAAGIMVEVEAPAGSGTLVEGNTAHGNDSSGIAVNKIGHTLVRNTANNNMAWGIYSSVATSMGMNVDGGGNRAVGNKELFQCFEVRCDGTPPVRETFPPDTAIEEGPSGTSPVDRATFRFSGADNSLMDVEFECRLDGGAFGPCVSPRSYSDLATGVHVFEVRSIDPAGNVDPTPARRSWTYEPLPQGVAPQTLIESGPDAVTVRTSATFRLGSDEPDVTFECALDGAAFSACESPVQYGGLAIGEHALRVRATDGEGNTDATPATHAWRVAAPPQPAAVSCGQVLTQSVQLTNSLTDCPGDGIVVGAHAITIDLGGQTIDGLGVGAGIRNSRFDDVTITNGSVQEFAAGVDVGPSARNVVASLTVQLQTQDGIRLSGAANASVRSNTVTTGLGDAIALLGGTRAALVRDNTVSGNLGGGIRLANASANRIEENSVIASEDMAIALEGSVGNTIARNTLTGNAGGIEVALLSHDARVERNAVTAGEGGIGIVESDRARVLDNVVEQAAATALVLDSAAGALARGNDLRFNEGGIDIGDSSGARVESNTASATTGTGLAIDGASLDAEVIENQFDANGGEGIFVEAVAPAGRGALIDRNSAMGNGDDGIHVAGSGHTIVTNVAHMNDGWGIYAEPGNVDGGGNLAAGNVEPLQCFGIACEDGGFVPAGLPDTTLLDRPADPSQSRNASFTFTGSDDTTALIDLEFQCRLDSTSELAWEDCENPQQYSGLAPGRHVFEVRALDAAEFADPTPARHEWTYTPLPSGVAPNTIIDLAPPAQTPATEAVFQFSSDEPDVTFECKMDDGPWQPCADDPEMVAAGLYAHVHEFEDFEVGPHRFQVRARDPEGNVDATPAVHDWRISGLLTTILSGPAFEPGEAGEPPSGGETDSTTATFDFVANVSEAAFECSLDMAPFAPCESPVTYTGLAVGDHVFRVSATDLDGQMAEAEPTEYEWTVIPPEDTAPPETTIDVRPADGSSDTTFTFFAVDDQTPLAAMDFECRLDSTDEADWYGCRGEGPVGGRYTHNLLDEFPELAPGPHTFEVRAIDDPENAAEGNPDPTPARHTWTSAADTTAPETALTVVPASPTIETEASFEFAGTDNATPEPALAFECSLDGVAFEACDSPHDLSSLEPGEHTMRVRTVDLAGNPDPTPAAHTWTVIGAPETLINEAPAALTTETVAAFRFSSDQPGVTFECSFGGAPMEPCSSPVSYDVGGGGEYEFEVQATNAYGLVDETPTRHEWTVEAVADIEPPDTTILSGPEPVTTSPDAMFAFSASQAGSTFECRLDGGGFGDCSAPYELTGLAAGEHVLEVRAVDPAGNVDPTPASATWTVDGPPLTEILSGPTEQAESTSATFTFASSDPGSTFECFLDGETRPCSEPGITYTGLAVGEHIFAVRATDPGGQLELEWQEWEWEIVPVTAPETTLGEGPGAETVSREATFAFASNEEDSTFECSLDGAPFDACIGPAVYDGLEPGAHAFEVRAIDRFGNVDPTPARHEWSVLGADQLDTTITAGPPARTTEADAAFGFSANATGATFECSLDGAAFEACEPPVAYSGLLPGAHVLDVRAVDADGAAEATPARREWTVVGNPVTTFGAAPAATTSEPDARFEFAADQPGVTYLCSLDGAEPEPCTSPVEYMDVGGGAHTFEVEATNEFGLVEDPPALHEWTIDGPPESTPPDTSIVAAPPTETAAAEATFEFAGTDNRTPAAELGFECSLDGGAFESCSTPHTLQDVTAGEHTLRVRGVDEAGNADPSPASHSWRVLDVTAPETTIDAGPEDPTQERTAAFEFSADEAGVTFECALDGGAFEPCSAPHELAGLSLGSHTLAVRARDASGNADASPDVHEWTVEEPPDVTPPGTTVVSGPPATTPATSATFSLGADEAVDGFECALDGAPFAGCDSPHVIDGLSVGEHTLRVRAIDLAGNVDPTPVVHTWRVLDSTPPDTTITGGPTGSTTSTSASITFTATEAGSTFECSLDGGAFAACTSPRQYTGLATAAHEVRIRARDAAGNVDPTPASRAWTVTAAPICTAPAATLGAAADSWMLQSSSSQNYGTDSVLKVDTKNGANARGVVRFNLPAIPAGCQVTSARLRLYASSYKTGRTLQALRLGAAWTESTIRWNNQPSTAGASATVASGSGYREWTVTTQVGEMYTLGNHGFLIRDATENGSGLEQGFHSREKGTDNPPRLVLTFG